MSIQLFNMYQEVDGDLVKLGLEGVFDVVVQGNNCFCVQGAGLAPQFVKAFGTDRFVMERLEYKGNVNKLGTIDYELKSLSNPKGYRSVQMEGFESGKDLFVVNAYTQYNYGANHADGDKKPVDYEAITLVMRKINRIFAGKHVGLPYVIGAGLAGGDPSIIIDIIKRELKDVNVTMVKLNK